MSVRLSAATIIPGLRTAGLTSSEIDEVLRDINNGRHGVKQLRDEFAMACITGTLPGAAFTEAERKEYARWAYLMADAMMEVRDGG